MYLSKIKCFFSKYSLLILFIIFFYNNNSFGGTNQMEPIYKLNIRDIPIIKSVEYPVKKEVTTLFAVPEKNAVGTNCLDNAITLLKFEEKNIFGKNKIQYQTVRKNFLRYVCGGDQVFLPQFSDDTIGYTQTRGFLLFNIKDKSFTDYLICKYLETTLEDVAVIDAEKRIFIFKKSLMLGMDKEEHMLSILDLSSDHEKLIASYDLGAKLYWTNLGKNTFAY